MPRGAMLVFEYRLEFGEVHEGHSHRAYRLFWRAWRSCTTRPRPRLRPVPARETILASLHHASVGVEAVLAGSTVRMGDLLAMEPGHILMLAQPAGSPLELRHQRSGPNSAANGSLGATARRSNLL